MVFGLFFQMELAKKCQMGVACDIVNIRVHRYALGKMMKEEFIFGSVFGKKKGEAVDD